jgi:hypothetical protein
MGIAGGEVFCQFRLSGMSWYEMGATGGKSATLPEVPSVFTAPEWASAFRLGAEEWVTG